MTTDEAVIANFLDKFAKVIDEKVGQAVTQAVQQATTDAQASDVSRQVADTTLPADTQVSIHENPDPKSTVETVNRANYKNVGEMPASSAIARQTSGDRAVQNAVDFQQKANLIWLDNFKRGCEDEREAVRNHQARNSRRESGFDRAAFEVGPLEADSVDELKGGTE